MIGNPFDLEAYQNWLSEGWVASVEQDKKRPHVFWIVARSETLGRVISYVYDDRLKPNEMPGRGDVQRNFETALRSREWQEAGVG